MKPSPGMMLQLWLQPPLSNEHKSAGKKQMKELEYIRDRRVVCSVCGVFNINMEGTGQKNKVMNTFSCSVKKVFVSKECFTTKFLVRAIRTIVSAVTQLLGRQTDGVVGSTHVMRQLAHQRFAVVLIRVVLTVTVTITHPSFADAASCQNHKISIFSLCSFKTDSCYSQRSVLSKFLGLLTPAFIPKTNPLQLLQ